jgi:tetratricopeptide (TPR) repeat protein
MTYRRCIEALMCLLLLAPDARGAEDLFKQHYEAGLSLYSSEEYAGAVKEFQAAYAIKPKPRLLFNIGQSYRSLGNAHEALRFYLLYQAMESNPKPGLKAELEGYIAQMKSIVDQAERARRVEELAAAAPPPRPVIVSDPVVAPAPIVSSEATPPRKPSRAWIWGVAGGALTVVVVVGLAVGLTRESPYGGDVRHPRF